MIARFLPIAKAILSQPTAPFHEEAVRAEILRQLADCPHVTVEQDPFGNLIARYQRGQARAHSTWAFAAHMDHPAYVGDKFLGGVPDAYLTQKPATKSYGAYSMWDLPAYHVRGARLHSRACDDLIGCAAIVTMFQELESSATECTTYGLFTRAEEVGFVGAIQLAKSGLIPKDVTIISLETSSQKGGPVKMGAGVIIRVGDRSSIFDSAATATLQALAQTAKLPHQRALMQGGTCEATAYALYGYRTAAICVALGNYHNCGPATRIAMEYVSVADAVSMAQLCVLAASTTDLPDPEQTLRGRLEKNLVEYQDYLQPGKFLPDS